MGEDRKQQKLLTHGCVTAKEAKKSKKGKVMMSHSYIHADKLKFPSSLGAAKRPDFKTHTHTQICPKLQSNGCPAPQDYDRITVSDLMLRSSLAVFVYLCKSLCILCCPYVLRCLISSLHSPLGLTSGLEVAVICGIELPISSSVRVSSFIK